MTKRDPLFEKAEEALDRPSVRRGFEYLIYAVFYGFLLFLFAVLSDFNGMGRFIYM